MSLEAVGTTIRDPTYVLHLISQVFGVGFRIQGLGFRCKAFTAICFIRVMMQTRGTATLRMIMIICPEHGLASELWALGLAFGVRNLGW